MKLFQTFKTIFLMVFWLFLISCGATKPLTQTPPPDIPSKVVKPSIIQNISFVEEENYTRVQIEGSEVLESPFYKLLYDPLRIAIDVPNIDLKQIKEPVKINNGTVGEVLTTQFVDKGRIEIGLFQMTNYNILKEDKNLSIDIEKVKKVVEVKGEVKKEEAKEQVKKEGGLIIEKETATPPPELKKENAPPAQPVRTAVPDTRQKAKKILNFSFDQKRDFITLNIIADGKLGDYNAFKLDSPPRLVVDIWGVTTRYPKRTINIKNSFVKKVRIGHHPDKLRFVFESSTPNLPTYQVNPINDKLIVSFGNVPQPSEPQILLTGKTGERLPPPRAQIKGPIDFKQMDNKSRIVVSLTEEPQFESQMISKNTIAVDIKNAILPNHLQRGLDTSRFDSAVKYVDLRNLKKGKANDVRILITLKEEVPFETSKEGKNLFIDIEKPKKIETISETKKEEVPVETKKEEAKEEIKTEEVRTKEEKPVAEVKKPEKSLPPLEQKPVSQQPVAKKAEEEKIVPVEGRPEKIFTGRRLSLDFKDADIKNILRLIAEVSDFNIITGDDVSGKITMRLVEVPWDQALDIILQARSLGMTKVGNVIRIAPLDSLKKEIQAELESRRAKEKLEDLMTELIPVNYASGKEILPQLKGILSDRGDVRVDDRTNVLIVKDIPRNIVAAKNLVKSLDTKTPQILIEARIVQADLTFQRDLGISWGFLASENSNNKAVSSVGGGTGSTSTLRAPMGTATVNTRKLVDLPVTGGGIFEFLFTSEYGLKNLDVMITAFESKGDVNVISSPKIATLDNKEASVEQGLRIPYTKLTADGTPTEDFIEANLKLTVTPHVTNDGHIKMSIRVKKDEPNYDNKSNFGTPSIDKKEAVTEVLVKDNGVVVIAGIYTIKKNEGTTGVPLLSKIPVLGWLFKKQTKKDDRSDLLIFISPKIFKDQV